ncbi:hypothetical protein O6H91_11G030000 [Diphasiastrum complanatum]|nr:hypothetical protein O6H91_11G030000 [Diphasiastrum complanatum]
MIKRGKVVTAMGSLLGDWPSYNPQNFSQLRPSDPSHPLQLSPVTYCATHNRTIPPPDQVISTEVTNILLRQFYRRGEAKASTKRSAVDSPSSEHINKQRRGACDHANMCATDSGGNLASGSLN